MTEVAKKRLELIAELDGSLPDCKRMRGRHLVLGKEVEVRVAEAPGKEGPAGAFVQEMLELSFLDHPAFPPVLDRGMVQGRFYYVVPLRPSRDLEGRVEDESLAPPTRGRLVRSLASSLSALHRAGIVASPPDPRVMGWDQDLEHLHLHHPRLRPPGESRFLEALPEEWRDATPELNVLQWATFAYWWLTAGKAPFEGGQVVPLAQRVRAVPPELVELIDVCLFGEDDERPTTGPELLALLQLVPEGPPSLVEVPDVARVPDRPGLRASTLDVKQTLTDLRARGSVPAMGDVQEGPVARLRAHLGELELPSLGDLPSLDTLAGGNRRVLFAGGLAVLLLIGFFFSGGGDAAPAVRVGEAEIEHLRVPETALREDPYLQRLLAVRSVTREEFPQLWRLVRTLAIQSRLPEGFREEKRILSMHATFQDDPDAACGDLEHFLEELGVALGG